jgi:hypothetical protein
VKPLIVKCIPGTQSYEVVMARLVRPFNPHPEKPHPIPPVWITEKWTAEIPAGPYPGVRESLVERDGLMWDWQAELSRRRRESVPPTKEKK